MAEDAHARHARHAPSAHRCRARRPAAVAIIDPISGGVATKQDLDPARSELHGPRDGLKADIKVVETKVEGLDNRVTLMFGVAILTVIVPALGRVPTP
jgi:hypothetical protein